jgi:hypothetical protein
MYCAGVSAVPLALNGPVTAVNCGSEASCRIAAATASAVDQTGCRSRSTRMVGLTAVCGKCRASSALPAPESVPAGAVTAPPNPAATYPAEATASAPKMTRPPARVSTGRRTIRAQTRPHHPARPAPGLTEEGQKAAGPTIASRAGSSVSPAMSISPIAIDSGAASPE